MKYIDTDKLKEKVTELIASTRQKDWPIAEYYLKKVIDIIDSFQQEQPEPYFYCKYGGTIPLCSDCKRNHNNSSFKTEEITTWYATSNGTKHCADYIQQEQPKVDLEKGGI